MRNSGGGAEVKSAACNKGGTNIESSGSAASILRLWRGPSPRACMQGLETSDCQSIRYQIGLAALPQNI